MTPVAHLQAEEHRDVAAVGTLHRHGVDVRVGVADRRGQLRQQSSPIRDQHANARLEHALHVGRPFDVDELAAVEALLAQRGAVTRMHDQALALAELADDRIAGHRPAALGVLDRHALDTAQRQRGGRLRARRGRRR